MCGRFANSETIPVLAARLGADVAPGSDRWSPSFDVRPTQAAPVLLGGPRRRLGLMTWGWSRDFAAGGRLINARVETAAVKPTFAEALRRRRCVVPATAYYEWRRDAADRPIRGGKHAFQAADGGWLLMAGLWEPAEGPDGTRAAGFIVLTRAMVQHADIHDRTPVLVTLASAAVWLDPQAPPSAVRAAAQVRRDDDLIVRPVCDGPNARVSAGPQLLASTGEPWPTGHGDGRALHPG